MTWIRIATTRQPNTGQPCPLTRSRLRPKASVALRPSATIAGELAAAGHRVVVTGGPDERELARFVAGADGEDAGDTTLAGLAEILAGAACVVVANTGPAHLAAAVGTPVVSLFAPTVPYGQWGPYRVPNARLGVAGAPCRDTRATTCPVPGHPCLSTIEPEDVVAAVGVFVKESVAA